MTTKNIPSHGDTNLVFAVDFSPVKENEAEF